MPNHFHGIIVLTDKPRRGGSRTAPTTLNHKDIILTDKNLPINPELKRKTLGRLIGVFKTVSTKQINLIRNMPGTKIWQRLLENIRQYIINNSLSWHTDSLHPNNSPKW